MIHTVLSFFFIFFSLQASTISVPPQTSTTNTLKGKVALVTGSTSGIGLEIAKALLKAGAYVVVNGRSSIHPHFKDLQNLGTVAYCKGDLSQEKDIQNLIHFTQSKFGSIDILINNAGVQHVSPLKDFPVERWHHIIALNLSAAFHCTQLSLPFMEKKKWGRIINISSVHGLVGSKNKAAYVTAKHGLLGLTKVTGLEYAGTGITCNAICPGWVLTPLVQAQVDKISKEKKISNDDAIKEILFEKQPSLQFVTAQQIADMVLFLCSSSADQITGTSIAIDGGWVAR